MSRLYPHCRRAAPWLAALIVTLAPMAAQNLSVTHESLTGWTHAGGAPNWTDDVVQPKAEFGKVDQLNSIVPVLYTSGSFTLQPGTYVAGCRLMKFLDSNGMAPFELLTVVDNQRVQVTLPVADQVVDQFVRTPNLIFQVTKPNTQVVFVLQAIDSSTKTNYQFDSFFLGRSEFAHPLLYESLHYAWQKSWGAPYFTDGVPDAESAFGLVSLLNNVWWMDWRSATKTLEPGTYTAVARLKKVVNPGGAWDLEFFVNLPAGQQKVILLAANQTFGQYVYTPELVFTIDQPATPVRFHLYNLSNVQAKQNYHFDSFTLRRGAFVPFGQACKSSLGEVGLSGTLPHAGEPTQLQLTNVPNLALVAFATRNPDLDLSSSGMTGCRLYALPFALFAVTAQGGAASFQYTVPSDPSLHDATLYHQAFVIDAAANPAGIAASHGGRAVIGY